jgi:hypothetical protein
MNTATGVAMQQELENAKVRAALDQINNSVSGPLIHPYNVGTVTYTGNGSAGIAKSHTFNGKISLTITSAENGYLVEVGYGKIFIAPDIQGIADRVIALVAAMELEK